jgi:dephospho-CoA kinase
MLSRRGARVIDADEVAREVVAPGTTGLDAVVARFGRSYLKQDGTLDRRALADLVFSDDEALHDLNHIVHPLVRASITERVAGLADEGVVVLVVPLLVESGQYAVDSLVVVDCDEDVAVDRLVAQRGWTAQEARRRMASQATRRQRRAAADLVIDNSATSTNLDEVVDGAWRWIAQRATSTV